MIVAPLMAVFFAFGVVMIVILVRKKRRVYQPLLYTSEWDSTDAMEMYT
jgi:hypothetical protein